jgi:rSAM/selenodomain-associated transferase 1
VKAEAVAVEVLAKAPVPGFANTRLIPELGAHGAAMLQEQFIVRTVETACAAQVGPVRVWASPDASHAVFQELAARLAIALAVQPDGDLGERMLAATIAARGPALVIGADCPALEPSHVRAAAAQLAAGLDAVVIPAEDGGYVLIGTRVPQPALFTDMIWGTDQVMCETRRRLKRADLAWHEFAPLWDVDVAADLDRLRREQAGNFFI